MRPIIPTIALALALAGCGASTTTTYRTTPPKPVAAPKPVTPVDARATELRAHETCQWLYEHGEQERERLRGCSQLNGCTHHCPTVEQAEAEKTERQVRRQEHRINELQAHQEAESESRRLEQRESYCLATVEVAGC